VEYLTTCWYSILPAKFVSVVVAVEGVVVVAAEGVQFDAEGPVVQYDGALVVVDEVQGEF